VITSKMEDIEIVVFFKEIVVHGGEVVVIDGF
jgi:hypothetical protein